MKKLILIVCLVLSISTIKAQETNRKIPDVELKDLTGKTIRSNSLKNDSGLLIIDFFALWCKPCVLELDNINEVYDTWRKQTGVKMIAISIDDARSTSKVATFVNGRGWKYDIFLDPNSDFKRAMNVNNIPHTFLVKDGQVIWQHNSYAQGDEDELFEIIKKETATLKK